MAFVMAASIADIVYLGNNMEQINDNDHNQCFVVDIELNPLHHDVQKSQLIPRPRHNIMRLSWKNN